MNARRVSAAAGVVFAAQKTRQTATGIAAALEAAGLLQSPESAAEQLALLAEVDGFRAQRNAVFATNEELLARVERTGLKRLQVENENRTLRRRIAELESERAALLATHTPFPDSAHCRADLERWPCSTRVALPAPTGALAEDRHLADPLDHVLEHLADERPAAVVCRCDEPDADPYACEADDCTHSFSELNPFGSGARPVNVASAKVSRKCRTCGWRTSVWHVADGSAEAELHDHVARVHPPEDNRRTKSVAKLRGLLARQSGGAL
ncbi:hypothetical protein [Streptomyces sp. NPDC088726]|uniref:hypothetical protein n=1 Tax=Streptomyces sp. NPDC088726 TaxID=3365874 RepID=UPI003824DF0C